MAEGVPLIKLFFLAVRQLSKPIANRAKGFARESEGFRSMTVAVGRFMHRFQLQLGRVADGKESLSHIAPLNEQAAVNRGSEFLSEFIIYTIAGGTVVYEFNQQQHEKRRKDQQAAEQEARKEADATAQRERNRDELQELRTRVTLLDEQLWHLRQAEAARTAERLGRRLEASGGGSWARRLFGGGGGDARAGPGS